jgi:hypothetical protein
LLKLIACLLATALIQTQLMNKDVAAEDSAACLIELISRTMEGCAGWPRVPRQPGSQHAPAAAAAADPPPRRRGCGCSMLLPLLLLLLHL